MTWAITSLLVRTLIPVFNAASVNAIRSSLSGAFLLAWILLGGGLGQLVAVSPRAFGLLAVSILFAISIGDTVFFESTRSLGTARALTVAMTYPLIAAALAAMFFDEAITLQIVTGAVLTLGGLALIVLGKREETPGEERWWLGVGAATVASIAWAISVVLMKAPLREMDAVTAQAIRLPVAAALLWATPWTWRAPRLLLATDRGVIGRVLALSALTALSSVMFVAGLKYAGVAVATVLSSTAPMFAMPLGFFVLGERLTARAIGGLIVTVIGIAVLQL
ncbi:MAG: DMT family transporter [Candidatus Rokubacteria bacterium]|nr:DMT family transporter [Candidatus Rokubacteria bacterium]